MAKIEVHGVSLQIDLRETSSDPMRIMSEHFVNKGSQRERLVSDLIGLSSGVLIEDKQSCCLHDFTVL